MENTLKNNAISGNLGYTGTLAILPFDHRTGLYRELGWTEPLTPKQVEIMKDGRHIIYEAILKAVSDGIPQDQTIVFTDDEFGLEVLREAKTKEFITSLTTEQSGVPYFNFEHGDDFAKAIESVRPTMVKALVRYNPDGNVDDNKKSRVNLGRLSEYAHAHGYKFLIEPLIPPTETQLELVDADKKRFDNELRPALTVRMIIELQNAGVEPDIWKIEGFEHTDLYDLVAKTARQESNGIKRNNVGIIALGRNETDAVVESWLRAGAQSPAVIGFAVGRTIFLTSLLAYFAGTISRENAIETIARNFKHFYDVFIEAKKS